jgi:5-methylcytosine-specific restriction protein A
MFSGGAGLITLTISYHHRKDLKVMPLISAPCCKPGCRKPVYKGGNCVKHQPEPYQSKRAERLPDNWATLRKIVFKRDNYTCYICGSNDLPADTIDHIVAGDDHSLSNLAPVHDKNAPHCHRYKTSQEGVNARKNNMRPVSQNLMDRYREVRSSPPPTDPPTNNPDL